MRAVSGSHTRDPINHQAADLRLRRYGQRDQPGTISTPIGQTLYFCYLKVKVKFTLEQATKGQRGSRGIALLVLYLPR
jgi:hypothetical protein